MKTWKPFPKQEIALSYTHTDAFEILFGGARGPGKTDTGMVWLLGENISRDELYIHHPDYRALILRKTYEDLNDWLDRASRMYMRYGGEVVGKPAQIRFPSGAVFRCGHLRDKNSYMKYLGHEYQRELIEELTQIPDEKHYIQIMGSCRSTVDELRPQVFNTTNPGGPGHMWVKNRFVDHGQPMKPFRVEDKKTGKWSRPRVFIPSTLDDNPIILEKDPGYLQYLDDIRSTDEQLFKAWRYGDWDVFAGQMFSEFNRDKHVIKPFVPKEGTVFLSIDWGTSDHHDTSFSAYLSVLLPNKLDDGQKYNQVITFKEFCGNRKDPDEWAEIIYSWCKKAGVKPKEGIVDPSMVSNDHNRLPGNLMMEKWKELYGSKWISLVKGNNSRVGRNGGWAVMHRWLSSPGELPYWMMTEDCVNLIRTLPMLVRDEHNPEDVDTELEDHPADSMRYLLMYVKFVGVKPGSYSAVASKKRLMLPTDDSGLPYINPQNFF